MQLPPHTPTGAVSGSPKMMEIVLTEHLGVFIRDLVNEAFQDSLNSVLDIVTKVNSALHKIHGELDMIKSSQRSTMGEIESLKSEFHHTITITEKHSGSFDKLSTAHYCTDGKLREMTRKINRLEQLMMDCDVLVSNVEQRSDDEDTDHVITGLAEKLNLRMDSTKIKHCSRMKSANRNNIPPILIKFTDWKAKNEFIKRSRKRQLYNDQTGGVHPRRIFVHQRFTNTYQQLDKIIRMQYTTKNYLSWYDRGSFFLRHNMEHTPIEVNSLEDLPRNHETS